MTKHLVLIHGRDKKPDYGTMLQLVRKALISGLERVDQKAADQLTAEEVKLTFVYYGDINNRLLLERNPGLRDIMKEKDGQFFVHDDYYDEDLQRLIDRPAEGLNRHNYEELIRGQLLIGLRDDVARAVSPFVSLFNMSSRAIRKLLPDLGAYLNSRVVGSEIRERLQKPLAKAMIHDDVMLLSHSMGCMVAYDVLWKFSRMSEYKELWPKKLPVWLTLGNPLGEPSVQKGLYDSNEPNDGRYPANILEWVNINAVDDYIAHDPTIADDFRPMLHERLVGGITDGSEIYNLWIDHLGKCNPHNLFGYLNHPDVALQVAKWINAK